MEEENLAHFSLRCPMYRYSGMHLIQNYKRNEFNDETEKIGKVLCINNSSKLNDVFNFVIHSLRISSFVINK